MLGMCVGVVRFSQVWLDLDIHTLSKVDSKHILQRTHSYIPHITHSYMFYISLILEYYTENTFSYILQKTRDTSCRSCFCFSEVELGTYT
jgi:hypothetical protein